MAKNAELVTINAPRKGIGSILSTIFKPFRSSRLLFKNFWAFLIIIILVIGAQVTLFEKPVVGVYINAFAFTGLIGLALWLAISAAILPVAMMITLSLPETSTFAQSVVFYCAILLMGLIYRFMFTLDEPVSNSKLKLGGYILALPLSLVIGQALGAAGYGLLRHQYTFGHTALPLVAVASVVFAISEEVLFRGLIQQRAAKVLHPGLAAVLSAVLYAGFTFGHAGSYLAPLFGLIMGITLAITYYRKNNLILTIAINAASKLAYVGLMASFVFR
jgi:membrane protease YdiL (CAAX protease family)